MSDKPRRKGVMDDVRAQLDVTIEAARAAAATTDKALVNTAREEWGRVLDLARASGPGGAAKVFSDEDVRLQLATLKAAEPGRWSRIVDAAVAAVLPKEKPTSKRRGEQQEMPEGVPDAAVMQALLKTEKMPPRPAQTVGNLEIILSQDYRWLGRITYNTMRRRVEIDGELADEDAVVGAQIWIERVYRIVMSKAAMRDAVRRVARENPENPVQTYLNSLEWDGTPRIHRLFTTYFEGRADNDDALLLLGAFGSKWMISAVARACRAPVKVDTLPVLYGEKGVKKSSACSLLFGERWFADTPIDPAKKDAMEQLVGVWLYEWAEFDQWLVKRGDAKIRSFLSSKSDHFRWSHAEDVVDYHRTGVFVGTTNVPDFSPDEERRFWPVHVLSVDIPAIRRDRGQLWAEARTMFERGATWWLSDEEEESFKRYFRLFERLDPWEEQAIAAVRALESAGCAEFSISEVMQKMGLNTRDMTSEAASRVGMCLRRAGLEKHRPRGPEGRTPRWRRAKDGVSS